MGFVVNSKYAVQHYSSAMKYIEAILTRDDMFDISPFRARFAEYQLYHQIYTDLRKRLEIVEYEPNQFINFRKLERGGLTREMVKDFCDAVYEAAPDGQIFTIRLLQNNGFESELFDFGFADLFYGNLLMSDERYSFKKMFGTVFLRKDKKEISTKTLLTEIVTRERRIEFYDLETLLCEDYGCKSVERIDCIYRTKNSELFYDNELQIFYANEELYYREIDEMGGL
jgi:virulence-associated protein VapD